MNTPGKKNNRKTIAVVLGVRWGGYGIIRSLAYKAIPIIAFERFDRLSSPECATKLCQIYCYSDTVSLYDNLVQLAEQEKKKPVLYLSSDEMVEFFLDYQHELSSLYLIHFPSCPETVQLLLHKDKFVPFVEQLGLPIAKTKVASNKEEIQAALDQLAFPCIVKPYKHSSKWQEAGLPKAAYFRNQKSLLHSLDPMIASNEKILFQEWIPGPDHNIYDCMVYYSDNSTCLAAFPRRKIHQYPQGTGIGSYLKPSNIRQVREKAIQFFNQLNYSGFGTIELKQHACTGQLFIIEATVGRFELNGFISTANGFNMPAIAYDLLTEGVYNQDLLKGKTYNINWFDEELELRYIIKGLLNNPWQTLKDIFIYYRPPFTFRYFCLKDLGPFCRFVLSLFSHLANQAFSAKKEKPKNR